MSDFPGADVTGSCVLPDMGAGTQSKARTRAGQAISQAPASSLLLVKEKESPSIWEAEARGSSSKPALAHRELETSPVTIPRPAPQKRRAKPSVSVGGSIGEGVKMIPLIEQLNSCHREQRSCGGLWAAIHEGGSKV